MSDNDAVVERFDGISDIPEPAAMKDGLADVAAVDKGPWVIAFGDDRHSWNLHADDEAEDGEGSGLPGEKVIQRALAAFANCWGDYDIATAARIFNLPQGLIEPLDILGPHATSPADVPIDRLGPLVQVLSATRTEWGSISVADVARLTNQPPERIVEAVEASTWTFLSGTPGDFANLMIEHDGE